ncbi:glycosyltransferase [Isoptericola dokdonensis]|uniref:Glycosyl transferase family 2 n=1 Tax=Isoptericola dokdonensis DS-3 TaxID=1300344 RepID=A0A161I3P7_9MICO|nr:glycosyltransferase [Isoptericola dokdonensis]ANC32825.1 Glycosyl transferase family 2 [Isoptericola dokdonensis DS-3]
MTAPHLTRTHADGAAPHGATPQAALTDGRPPRAAVAVAAVVVTQGRTAYLPATLEALAAQVHAPDDVVVIDVDAAPSTAGHADLSLGGHRFVGASGSRTLGDAVNRALSAGALGDADWIWVLHDDSAPAPDALSHLLRAVEHSAAVAVAGPKQVRWDVDESGHPAVPDRSRPGVLVEVGFTVSPLGRRMTGIDDTEIDQGQHDAREDWLAVGLAGALVRRSVWEHLGGPDPEAGRYGDSLDLCRRARLAGHRVVVVPAAVVHHAQASLRGLRGRGAGLGASAYARRRSQLHARLAGVPLPLVPVAMVAMVVWAPFAAAYRLALKRPARARDELLAPLVTVLRVVPLVRGRRRAAATRTQPRRVLRPLRASWRRVAAERRDARLTRAEAHRVRRGPTDLERAELRRLARRRRTALALVLVPVTLLAAAVFAPWQGTLVDGGRITGGALLPAPGSIGDAFAAATSGWVRDALGTGAPADPLLAVLTALGVLAGGSVQTAVNLLVVAALPLAALAGWFGAGVVTRSVWARAAAALVWTATPGFLASLSSGRLGAVVAHLALPWVLVATIRALGTQARDGVGPARFRSGSLGAAAAAGLLLAVAVCGAPVLLPAAVLTFAGVLVVARRSWRRLALVLAPAVVVGLPFWWHAVATWSDGGWRALLAEPGVPLPSAAPDGLTLLLGQPAPPTGWLTGTGLPGPVAAVGPWLLGGAVLVLAVAALVGARHAAAVRGGFLLAAVGLVVALTGVGTAVASGSTDDGTAAVVHGWPGAGLSVLLLGLGCAALSGVPRPGRHPARRVGVGVLAALALALPVGGLAVWWTDDVAPDAVGSLTATGEHAVPAVGRQLQAAPRAARVLQLDREGGVVEYAVLHADGTSLLDSSTVVRARTAGLAPGPERTDVAALDTLVAQVSAGRSPDLAEQLTALGVGAVQVPAAGDRDLVTSLDLVPGLHRVTEGGVLLWRVGDADPGPGWATVLDAPDADPGRPVEVLASDGRGVATRVGVGEPDRTLVLAETAGEGWRATLDGRRLTALDVDGRQAFDLGGTDGYLVVEHAAPSRPPWLALTALVLVVVALLALPVGRRRTR